jgi:hypothetical protein
MKRFFLLVALALGLAAPATTPAHAQVCGVNTVPQIGVICAVVGQPTYTATAVLLAPASSATDIMCLNGSTTKTVSLRRVLISGTAATAITTPVLLNLNHSLDTAGTPATGLALPVAAPLNPSNAAATATVTAWTTNGTVNDTTPNLLWGQAVPFPVTTTATNPITQIEAGPGAVTLFSQSWDIPKAGTVVQQICINLDGKTIATGLLNITFEWAEN